MLIVIINVWSVCFMHLWNFVILCHPIICLFLTNHPQTMLAQQAEMHRTAQQGALAVAASHNLGDATALLARQHHQQQPQSNSDNGSKSNNYQVCNMGMWTWICRETVFWPKYVVTLCLDHEYRRMSSDHTFLVSSYFFLLFLQNTYFFVLVCNVQFQNCVYYLYYYKGQYFCMIYLPS